MKYGLFEKESENVMFGELKRYEESDKEHNCYTEDYYEVRPIKATA